LLDPKLINPGSILIHVAEYDLFSLDEDFSWASNIISYRSLCPTGAQFKRWPTKRNKLSNKINPLTLDGVQAMSNYSHFVSCIFREKKRYRLLDCSNIRSCHFHLKCTRFDFSRD